MQSRIHHLGHHAWEVRALLVVLVAYLFAFGPSAWLDITGNLQSGVDSGGSGGSERAASVVFMTIWKSLCVAAALWVCWRQPGEPRWLRTGSRIRSIKGDPAEPLAQAFKGLGLTARELGLRDTNSGWEKKVLMFVAAAVACYTLMQASAMFWSDPFLTDWSSGYGSLPFSFELMDNLDAGFNEELLLLAIPIAIVTRLQWSATTILLIVLPLTYVARLLFHLHNGDGTLLAVGAWLLGVTLLYLAFFSIWPFILAHAAVNLSNYAYPTWMIEVLRVMEYVTLALGAFVWLALIGAWSARVGWPLVKRLP